MITNIPVVYICPKQCPYTIEGVNLAEMRRAKLRTIAKKLKLSPDGTKQEILRRLIGRLAAAEAPSELTDL